MNDPNDIPTADVPSDRRRFLALGAAGVAGVAAMALRGDPASATTGAMQYGTSNNAGASNTSLTASVAALGSTFTVTNASTGYVIDASSTNASNSLIRVQALGNAVALEATRAAGTGPAVDATNLSGTAIRATGGKLGYAALSGYTDDTFSAALSARNGNAASTATVVNVQHDGLGDALVAYSQLGGSGVLGAAYIGAGHGVIGNALSSNGTGHGVYGTSYGTGHGVRGSGQGAGHGVYGTAKNAANGVRGESSGSGYAVYAKSLSTGDACGANGGATARGVVGYSGVAPLRLKPYPSATHPASGAVGDFFVDSGGRLWFCKGGSGWTQLA